MFSLEVLYYQDTDAREESNDFLVEYSSTSAVFDWDFDGGNRAGGGSELVVNVERNQDK